jgi:hypothetical protein
MLKHGTRRCASSIGDNLANGVHDLQHQILISR